jgi:hypothetical protein
MYEASIPEFSFRKTGVCNVITKKIFAKYVLNSDLRPQMTPRSITCFTVVPCVSVQLAFIIEGMNDLDKLAGDVTIAYLDVSLCREKVWLEGGIETGEDCGNVLVIRRALHDLKSSAS